MKKYTGLEAAMRCHTIFFNNENHCFNKKAGTPFYFLFLSLLLITFSAFPETINAQQLSKPKVGVIEPRVGTGIPQNLYDYLNVETVWAEVEACLRATRHFDVVTRQVMKLKDIRKEQNAAQTRLFQQNAARQGRLQNVDYMIFITVQDFEFKRINQAVPNISNKFITRETGLLGLSIQVIDTETGQIKSSIYATSDLSTQDQVINTQEGEPSRILFTHLAKGAASHFTEQLTDAVFPMAVVNVEADQVWINRGADAGLKEGDILFIYRPGKDIYDPYSKEKLGKAESLVGKARIVRVNPKVTVAELLHEETSGTVLNGDILRKP